MFSFSPIALLGDVSLEKEIHYEQNSPIKMSLVWVVFMEWSVHVDVTSTSSLGKYRISG